MEQKIIATVGGHQITEAEVEAFIHSLPREQQAYAAHPDFRKQLCRRVCFCCKDNV